MHEPWERRNRPIHRTDCAEVDSWASFRPSDPKRTVVAKQGKYMQYSHSTESLSILTEDSISSSGSVNCCSG
jgi:hypothetical protein